MGNQLFCVPLLANKRVLVTQQILFVMNLVLRSDSEHFFGYDESKYFWIYGT